MFDLAESLEQLKPQELGEKMQHSKDNNPMDGVKGRTELLQRLGGALKRQAKYFGAEGRPGNLIGKKDVVCTYD